MLMRVAVTIVLLLLPGAAFAQAEKRIALLIGSKDYKSGVGALTNPLNDIGIVGEALKAIGFEVMKPAQNATRALMLPRHHRLRGPRPLRISSANLPMPLANRLLAVLDFAGAPLAGHVTFLIISNGKCGG